MQKYILAIVLLILLVGIASMCPSSEAFINLLIPSRSMKWENRKEFNSRPFESVESFENPVKVYTTQDSLLESPFSPVEPNNQPYHLLQDIMSTPRLKESLSDVTSRSCYATDFQRGIEKIGNFNQLTNNYKRNYPDSCTSPSQELVLNFYKTE